MQTAFAPNEIFAIFKAPPKTATLDSGARGRVRSYRFDTLGEGDVMSVALNGQPLERAWRSLASSARNWRDEHEPEFDFILFHNIGAGEDEWVHLERLPNGLSGAARNEYMDQRTLYRAHHIRTRRKLTRYETAKALRASERLERMKLEAQ